MLIDYVKKMLGDAFSGEGVGEYENLSYAFAGFFVIVSC